MARLPHPGGDEGNWGKILNDYLRTIHTDDGTLKPGSVSGAALQNSSVGNVKLQASAVSPGKINAANAPAIGDVLTYNGTTFAWVAQASGGTTDHGLLNGLANDDHPQYHTDSRGDIRYYTKAQIDTSLSEKANTSHAHAITDVANLQSSLDTKYSKPGTGIPEADLSSEVQQKLNAGASVSDATATTKGVVQLAGDLSGTAAAPTVPGLASKINSTEKGAANGVATLDTDGKVPSSQLAATAIPDATATSKGVVQLAGDLGGTAAAPIVPGLSSKANSADVVLLAGTQTITGAKDFTGGITINGTGVVVASDARLTDERTPVSASVTPAKLNSLDVPATGEYLTYNGSQFEWVPTPSGAVTSVNTKTGAVVLNAADVAAVASSDKGVANGVATLGVDGKVPASQLPVSSATNRNEIFFHTGALTVKVGSHRLYNDTGTSWTISGIRASVGGAPDGSSIIIDVHKSGTTIFTTQTNRPAIAATTNTSGKITTMDINTVADGEYLTVDIDQVGSTVTGSDLTVQITIQ